MNAKNVEPLPIVSWFTTNHIQYGPGSTLCAELAQTLDNLPLFFFEVVISRRIRLYVRIERKHSYPDAKVVILIQITNQTICSYETFNKKQNPLFGYF